MSRPTTPSEPAVKSRQSTGVARILTGYDAPVLQSRLAASTTTDRAGGDGRRRRPSRRAQPDHRRPIADRDPCPRYVEKSQKALVRECTGGLYGEQHHSSPEVLPMPWRTTDAMGRRAMLDSTTDRCSTTNDASRLRRDGSANGASR